MIVNRNGRFGVSLYDASLGRKRWIGTFATRRAAKQAERAASTRRGVGSNLTCGEFAARWLIEYARPAAATRRNYGYATRQFVSDLGRARLGDLDRPRARAWALSQPRSRVRAARAHELQALADVALAVHGDYGPTFRAMILFAGYVGLRPGELFALERTDVRGDEVTIRRNLDAPAR